MRQTFKPGRMTLVSLACTAMLTACGGGGGGGGQGKLQVITFNYAGGVHMLSPPTKLSATTSSGLPVTFVSTTPATCTVSGDMLSPVSAGQCRVVATQNGGNVDGVQWASADEVTALFNVLKTTQFVGFLAPPPDFALPGAEVTLPAAATSGLPVTFSVAPAAVCSINGTTIKLLSKGSCAVTATQAGSETYAAAKVDAFIAVDPLVVANGILGAGQGSTEDAMTKQGGKVKSLPWSSIVGGGWQSSCNNTNDTCFRTVSPDERIFTSHLHLPRRADYGWHDTLHSLDIFAPGLSGFNQSGDTTGGLQAITETTFAMTLGVNKGLFDAKKPIVLHLDLGKRNNNCNVTVSTLVWPAGVTTGVGIPLDTFAVTEACGLPGVDAVSVDNDIRRLENYNDPAGFTAYQTRLNDTAFAKARTSAGTLIKSSNIVRVRFRLPDVNLSHEDVPGDGIHASDISIIGAIKIQ